MAEICQDFLRSKKPSKPTVRELNTPLLTLRALQLGVRLEELELLEVGELIDVLTESANDSYEYPVKATQEDMIGVFGG